MANEKSKIVKKKPSVKKGVSKVASEKDTDKNPLLHIASGADFSIEVGNFLEDSGILIYPDYENFTPSDPGSLDSDRLDTRSDLLIILRYFEYVILAKFKVSFILPLLKEGMRTGDMSLFDIMQSIEHRLQMELQLRTPTFDTINVLDIRTLYKVRYVSPEMIIDRKPLKKEEDDVE